MSYLVKRQRASMGRRRARAAGMGDIGDSIMNLIGDITGVPSVSTVSAAEGIPPPDTGGVFAQFISGVFGVSSVIVQDVVDNAGGAATSVCIAQANAQQAQFDTYTQNLAENWHPSGYYTPDQLHSIVTQVMALVTKAQSDVASAQGSWSGDPGDLQNAADTLARVATGNGVMGAVGINGTQWLALEQTARSKNVTAIDAADLKTWAVNSLLAVSNAYVTIYVVNCQEPFWISAIAAIVGAIASVVGVLMAIAGAVVGIGSSILHAPQALNGIVTLALYAGLAYLGFRVYQTYKKG
jgi:hypothetical protein